MIKFKTKPVAEWIKGDDEIFDASELGNYPKEDRSKVEFQIHPFTPALIKRLRIDAGKDDEAYQRSVLTNVILDWKGVPDEDNNPIKCSLENMITLFDGGYPKLGACLIAYAATMMSKYVKTSKKKKEKELKNLQTSQAGPGEGDKI